MRSIDDLSDVKWDKLTLLADGIERETKFEFSMHTFRSFMKEHALYPLPMLVYPDDLSCGTIACALGHGPSIEGLQPDPECFEDDASEAEEEYDPVMVLDWDLYSRRIFGLQEGQNAWAWLFSAHWRKVDNTREGAVARIRWMIAHKRIPDNWEAQLYRHAPLCYQSSQGAQP